MHTLPYPQHLSCTVLHDGVHPEGHRAAQHIAAPVGLQQVAHCGVADGGGGVYVGNGTARAGFDEFELRFLQLCGDVQHIQAVFFVRGQAAEDNIGPKTRHAHSGMAHLHQLDIEFVQRRLAEHEHRETVREQIWGLDITRPARV